MFLAVYHSWHVHSKGFEVLEIDTNNEDEARKTALVRKEELNKPFKETDFMLIELSQNECPIFPSTRWEKFVCWLKYSHDMDYVGGGVDVCKLCDYTNRDD